MLGKLRGGHQEKSAKHMFLGGEERLGGSTPSQSSPTAEEDDALSTVSFQGGIFLSQQLLTHGHSAHCYLERQHITHGQHHSSQLNHFPRLRQESLEGFCRTSSHTSLSEKLHLLPTAGRAARANQAVEKPNPACHVQALPAQHKLVSLGTLISE